MNRQSTTVRISKLLSLMLRHRPDEFGIEVDEYGSADLEAVVAALQDRDPDITLGGVESVVNDSTKKRFEIVDGRVRARYGHSFSVELGTEPTEPPEFLYKGVETPEVEQILQEGLTPGDRQYVHLSFEAGVAAEMTGRTSRGAVIRIDARRGHEAGVQFYDCGPTVLTLEIPPEFVSLEERPEPPRRTESDASSSQATQPEGSVTYGRKPRPGRRR